MLEKLGTPGQEMISTPDQDVLNAVSKLIETANTAITIAELGVGIGATTLEMAKMLNNKGAIHIFDFENKVTELRFDLAIRGFNNIVAHGNSNRYWDSYHWSLAKLIEADPGGALFDLIYIDGAHTYLHDALAFFLCDRLLRVDGLLIFDDYYWSYAVSRHMLSIRHMYMTDEQINERQIKMIVDTLVKNHSGYREVVANKTYRKTACTHDCGPPDLEPEPHPQPPDFETPPTG